MFLIQPFREFVDTPSLALLAALVSLMVGLLGVGIVKYRNLTSVQLALIGVLAAPVLWMAYGVWEITISLIYRAGDPVIRVDLFLIGPLLYCTSLVQLCAILYVALRRR